MRDKQYGNNIWLYIITGSVLMRRILFAVSVKIH